MTSSAPCAVSTAKRTVRDASAAPFSGRVSVISPSASSAATTACAPRALRVSAATDASLPPLKSSSTSRRTPRSESRRASPVPVMAACRSLSIHARGGIAVVMASPIPHA